MTIEELVNTLYSAIRSHWKYDSEANLPRMELHYRPTLGWELFITDGGEAVTPTWLFYKLHESPEEALLENIDYFELFYLK